MAEAREKEHGPFPFRGPDEVFARLTANGRFRLVQGTGQARTVPTRKTPVKLKPTNQQLAPESDRARVVLPPRVFLPNLSYRTFGGDKANLEFPEPTLVQLWVSWCPLCQAELHEFSQRARDVRSASVRVVALSVDGLGSDTSTVAQARTAMYKLGDNRWKFGARRFAAANALQPMLLVFRNGRFDFRKPKTPSG